MRKYDEGYTLPLVLVVFIIISLVAVSILTVSVHNLHSQKMLVQRMEEQYAAQGEMEKVEAVLRASVNGDGSLSLSEPILDTNIRAKVQDTVLTLNAAKTGTELEALELNAVTTRGAIQITAVFRITGGQITEPQNGVYQVTNAKIAVASYDIAAIEPATEESTGGS